MNELSWLLFVLTCIGAFNVGSWILRQYVDAWRMLDDWSERRAFMLCAHAIVANELRRGRHLGPSIKYALKIMRGEA